MDPDRIDGSLAFIREAERLKSVIRSAWTSSGRAESTAEHTWRLCLMVMVFERELGDVDLARVLKLCIIHDLGEAISGDIPATEQDPNIDKSVEERADLLTLLTPLDAEMQGELLELWDEYENATTPEAKLVKGLDKLETIIQHNQGANPANFDYDFNLHYGARHTRDHPLLEALRERVDADTRDNSTRSSEAASGA